MLIRKPEPFRYSEITPKSLFYNRRQFLAQASAAIAAMAAPLSAATKLTGLQKSPFSTTDKPNTFQQVTTYNNFYEFGTDKSDPSHNAKNFKTEPWTVSIEGAVAKPRKFTIEEIRKLAPLEERVYRLRCVEAWSAIVPWVGYSFSTLLNAVSPTSKAKYVAFETFFDARQMPEAAGLHFPYVEGLRLDEAMHPLTLLAVGLYDDWLPPQNGAPVRMVIPWKYGFKGI
ncbi:MAG TPA: protein-methionine-sulfoxide reductase catalytic subunit MsrP, partial [Bryobacteraceae bacterium]|nr:protein-methionine-sulfoxide reductase catalytic subunit MsrP [Bryobacteraceae bacterium]